MTKLKKVHYLIFALSAGALIMVIPCFGLWDPQKTLIEWDFSKSRSIDIVKWPDEAGDDITQVFKDEHLEIIMVLPSGHRFEETAERVYVERRGKNVRSINVHFSNMTIKDGYLLAQRLKEQFGYPEERFKKWYEENRDGGRGFALFGQSHDNGSIGTSIAIWHSYDKVQPAFVVFTVLFSKGRESSEVEKSLLSLPEIPSEVKTDKKLR